MAAKDTTVHLGLTNKNITQQKTKSLSLGLWRSHV